MYCFLGLLSLNHFNPITYLYISFFFILRTNEPLKPFLSDCPIFSVDARLMKESVSVKSYRASKTKDFLLELHMFPKSRMLILAWT